MKTAPPSSSREYDVLTLADACVDLLVDLGDVLPQFGQVEQWVADYVAELGGSACLFACQAAKLGLRVGILGRVGADPYGELVLQHLRESGVDTRWMQRDPQLKTGLGITLCRPSGDRAILTYAGSLSAIFPADITDDFLRSGQHLHYASYYLQTNLLPQAGTILQRARALGLTVSLDTNWDPAQAWDGGLRAALAHVDLFFPNEQEALAIAGAPTLAEAMTTLLRWVPEVAIKQGAQGAWAGRGEGRWRAPVEPVAQSVDTVGAGDNFDAGYLAGWLRGWGPLRCAALGNACGRASALARGGRLGQLTTAELARFW